MEHKKLIAAAGIVALSTASLAACSSGGGQSSGASSDRASTLKVVYQKTDSFSQMDDMMQRVKTEFAADHAAINVSLEPIPAQESEYFTKLALMNGSASTAPDIIYEDTFQVRSDAAAGYLAPLDECVAGWEDWSQFEGAAAKAGEGDDGKLYGISLGTDTRGIYFNKEVFKAAGLPADWQPKTWDDILAAARKIQAASPDVIPLSVNTTKAQGEATSMQGFEMLLYGTGGSLYDEQNGKWIVGSQGFKDSLGFLKTVTDEKLLAPLEAQLDTNYVNIIDQKFRENQVGMVLTGSWVTGNWTSGENPWPGWEDVVGLAKMPTQKGQAPGFVSMSGGWLLSVGANAPDKAAACDFLKQALNRENTFLHDTENSQIAVRKDVATDPKYLAFNPTFGFFSDLVQYTHFRPATPDYPAVSDQIQIASESIVTGQATPEKAAAAYDSAIKSSLGEEKVVQAN